MTEQALNKKRCLKQSSKTSKAKDVTLHSEIAAFFEKNGIYNHSSPKLRAHLLKVLPESKVPTTRILREVLQNTFHLSFKRLDKASVHYRNPKYNPKRQWVSRLLAQFISEETLIISIDESNFRHDTLPSRQWQFNVDDLQPPLKKPENRLRLKRRRNRLNLLLRTDDEINYGRYLKTLGRG